MDNPLAAPETGQPTPPAPPAETPQQSTRRELYEKIYGSATPQVEEESQPAAQAGEPPTSEAPPTPPGETLPTQLLQTIQNLQAEIAELKKAVAPPPPPPPPVKPPRGFGGGLDRISLAGR